VGAVVDGAGGGHMIDRALAERSVREHKRMSVEGPEGHERAGAGVDGNHAVAGLEGWHRVAWGLDGGRSGRMGST
jgi:hypothetical protein